MKPRTDVAGLVTGLLALALAGLGLWSAFGVVNWAWVGFIAPLGLVGLGILGLLGSRT